MNADRELHRADGPALVYADHAAHYLYGIRTDADYKDKYDFSDHIDYLGLCINIEKFLDATGLCIDNIGHENDEIVAHQWNLHCFTQGDLAYIVRKKKATRKSVIDYCNSW